MACKTKNEINEVVDIAKIKRQIKWKKNRNKREKIPAINDSSMNDPAFNLNSKESPYCEEIKNNLETTYKEIISIYDEKPVALIRFVGALEESTIEKFTNLINFSISKSLNRIILDFEKLTYVNGSGLNALVQIANRILLNSGTIIIIKTPVNIYKMFELVGFHQIFIFQTTLQNALFELSKISFSEFKIRSFVLFPFSYQCSYCNWSFNIPSKGQYNCPNCETFIMVNDQGNIEIENLESEEPFYLNLPTIISGFSFIREALVELFTTMGLSVENEIQFLNAINEACGKENAFSNQDNSCIKIALQIFGQNKQLKILLLDSSNSLSPYYKSFGKDKELFQSNIEILYEALENLISTKCPSCKMEGSLSKNSFIKQVTKEQNRVLFHGQRVYSYNHFNNQSCSHTYDFKIIIKYM